MGLSWLLLVAALFFLASSGARLGVYVGVTNARGQADLGVGCKRMQWQPRLCKRMSERKTIQHERNSRGLRASETTKQGMGQRETVQ